MYCNCINSSNRKVFKMTRKHYIAISKAIRQSKTSYSRNKIDKDMLVNELCIIFARDNNLFSRSRFVDACNDM